METVLLSAKNKSDLKLLLELARKLGMKSQLLSREEVEDFDLAKKIEQGLKSESVGRENVIKVLKK